MKTVTFTNNGFGDWTPEPDHPPEGEYVPAAVARRLLDACRESLKRIALLTPFNPELSGLADGLDAVREVLRSAISAAEAEGEAESP